jgi:hypothetical protein
MGFLKKALGKSLGGKLLKKAVKMDPLGKKVMSKDPLGKPLLGGSKKGPVKVSKAIGAMKTGGVNPATPAPRPTMAGKRLNALGTMNRYRRGNTP